MLAPPWPSPPVERVLPLPVRAMLAAAHRRALEAARGRVLDLSPVGFTCQPGACVSEVVRLAPPVEASSVDVSGVDVSAAAARALRVALAGQPFDTVISLLCLAGVDDAGRRLSAFRSALAPSGRLMLVEPYRRGGWRGAFAGASMPLVRASTGLRIDHAVPALVRAAGLTITSIERKSMPALWVPFRSVVELTAVVSSGPGRP